MDKLSGIDEDGKFHATVQNPEKRFGTFMGPLSYGRAFVGLNGPTCSAMALSIAIKYASSRRQFGDPINKKETLLIDYPQMKYRLMPLLAQNVIYYIGGAKILRTYDEKIKQILDPKNKIVE